MRNPPPQGRYVMCIRPLILCKETKGINAIAKMGLFAAIPVEKNKWVGFLGEFFRTKRKVKTLTFKGVLRHVSGLKMK